MLAQIFPDREVETYKLVLCSTVLNTSYEIPGLYAPACASHKSQESLSQSSTLHCGSTLHRGKRHKLLVL